MKIHHEFARENSRPLSLAIGFFDGMHRGHHEIARAAFTSRKPGWRSGVLTFANHPATYLRPGSEPPLLTTNDERVDLLGAAGFEECFFLPFDASVASLTAEQFLDRLVHALGVRAVAVGSTFRFGNKRAGDTSLMTQYFGAHDVVFSPVENVAFDGERVSSTRIRTLVADGALDRADELLGRSYEIRGRVELGFGRGHDLGFPTANMTIPAKLLPQDAIYSAVARHDGRDYAALVSIGTNPQFAGTRRTIEVWMRDFHRTIYGQELVLRDLRYVRKQHVFASIDELTAQMRNDLAAVAYPVYG